MLTIETLVVRYQVLNRIDLGKGCCRLTINKRRKNVPLGPNGIVYISFVIPIPGLTARNAMSHLSNGMNRLSDSYNSANRFGKKRITY